VTKGPGTAAAAGSANSLGQCNTDSFSVTNPGGKAPPVICGTNTGEHMYVEADQNCNILNANFGSASTAGTGAFTIKVTQIECSSKTRAPRGCTQYFTGTTGSISSYNYQSGNGVLLYNQNYEACFRSERTTCSMCYYSPLTDFKLSVYNGLLTNGAVGWDTHCGAVGLGAGANGGGYDYITIPNGQCNYPSTIAVAVITVSNDRYCGTEFQCLASNTAASAENTVCTNSRPFKIAIHSDDAEYSFPVADSGGSLANNRGFKISWFQQTECQRKTL